MIKKKEKSKLVCYISANKYDCTREDQPTCMISTAQIECISEEIIKYDYGSTIANRFVRFRQPSSEANS